jgi:transcriptional regulator MraZ
MAFLTGTYLHTVDNGGRIAVPSKLRERLGEHVVVTYGRGRCVAIFPYDVWQKIAERATQEEPNTGEAENDMRLWTFAMTSDDQVDNQGRVSIPEHLRQDVGIVGEVAVVGVGDHLQVWDRDAWVAKRASLRERPPNAPGAHPGEQGGRT